MTREGAIRAASQLLYDGTYLDVLARRVAIPTTSQDPAAAAHLLAYLETEIASDLTGENRRLRVVPTLK